MENTINLLSTSYLNERRDEKRKLKIKKMLTVFTIIVLIAATVEVGIISYYYFSRNDTVPADIAKKYTAALETSERIKQHKTIYLQADRDDKALIQALDKLTMIKPREVNFTRLEVSYPGQTVQVEGYSTDPSVFNSYAERINEQKELFRNARVERISSTTTGAAVYKNFQIKAEIVR